MYSYFKNNENNYSTYKIVQAQLFVIVQSAL